MNKDMIRLNITVAKQAIELISLEKIENEKFRLAAIEKLSKALKELEEE